MCPLIDDNVEAIRALAREYGVARLEVFGSVCTPDFDPARSDVDFLVEYPEGYDFGSWMGRFLEFHRALADLLGHDVDLVRTKALDNKWFRREANRIRVSSSMHRRTPKWLEDIVGAGTNIVQWTADFTSDDYVRNDLVRAAVERNFLVIGEALIRIERVDPATVARIFRVPEDHRIPQRPCARI